MRACRLLWLLFLPCLTLARGRRPTIFPSVPRLLNRVYDKVLQGVSGSALKKALFNRALAAKSALLKKYV